MTWIGPDWFLALVAITLCVMLALSLLPSKPHPHPHSQGTTGVGYLVLPAVPEEGTPSTSTPS